MSTNMRRMRKPLLVAAHVLLIPTAYFAAFALRFDVPVPAKWLDLFRATVPYLLALRLTTFAYFRLYEGSWRHAGMQDLMDLLKAVSVSSMGLLVVLFMVGEFRDLPRSLLVLDWLIAMGVFGGLRFAVRSAREQRIWRRRAGRGRRALIIGAGDAAEALLRQFRRYESNQIHPVALVDDDQAKLGMQLHGIRVEGSTEDLQRLVEKHRIELLVIALPSADRRQMQRIVERCVETEIEFKVVPSLEELELLVPTARTADGGAVWFRSQEPFAPDAAAVKLAVLLLPAMRTGEPVVIDEPVSPRLLRSMRQYQEIMAAWYPQLLSTVPIVAEPRSGAAVGGGKRMAFFSGGVDSFYTVFKHYDSIDALLFVHGFDVPLEDVGLRRRIASHLRRAADELGKPLIEVETNLRAYFDPMKWAMTHGAGLMSAAFLFAGDLAALYVPSTYRYRDLFPWGTHPLIDPLWSTEGVEVIHDGAEAARVDKVREISKSDIAMRALRVCWSNPDGAYNCGRCSKCQRTLVNLAVVGAAGRCSTFDCGVDYHLIRRMYPKGPGGQAYVRENLEAARDSDASPELIRALEALLQGPTYRNRFYNAVFRRLDMLRRVV